VPIFHSEAIVLRSFNLSEADKLITLMTSRYGKIKCVAKAARKIKNRFGASIEPMSHIRLIYFGKENQTLYRLNHSDIIHSFQEIRGDLQKVYTGVYFIELIDTLIPEMHPDLNVFQLLQDGLKTLETIGSLDTLSRIFEMKLMCLAGYAPQFSHCTRCKKSGYTTKVGFSFEQRGIICEPCSFQIKPEIYFQIGILKYLKKLKTIDIKHANRLKSPKGTELEIEQLIHRIILSHTGRELKSYPFIRDMKKKFESTL
jgi:DNA repair protein RecO (recombination protein O)